jgi:lysyl endopeptidase
LLFNYNLLGAGMHTAQLFVNGTARGAPIQFSVTVPGGEFLSGISKQITVPDFPVPGKTAVLIWQESQQNFAIETVSP